MFTFTPPYKNISSPKKVFKFKDFSPFSNRLHKVFWSKKGKVKISLLLYLCMLFWNQFGICLVNILKQQSFLLTCSLRAMFNKKFNMKLICFKNGSQEPWNAAAKYKKRKSMCSCACLAMAFLHVEGSNDEMAIFQSFVLLSNRMQLQIIIISSFYSTVKVVLSIDAYTNATEDIYPGWVIFYTLSNKTAFWFTGKPGSNHSSHQGIKQI